MHPVCSAWNVTTSCCQNLTSHNVICAMPKAVGMHAHKCIPVNIKTVHLHSLHAKYTWCTTDTLLSSLLRTAWLHHSQALWPASAQSRQHAHHQSSLLDCPEQHGELADGNPPASQP